MNITDTIFVKDTDIDKKNIRLVKLEENEKNYMKSYVEITRHILEINQLFSMYKCNLGMMTFFYTLNSDDILKRNFDMKLKENDSMLINALTTNIISSGKTLVNSIETFLKTNTNQYQAFEKDVLNDIYDNCFSYRFLYHLRNFSQHGHLPVQVKDNIKCYFDLNQILKMPHINHNKKIEKEMEILKDEIYTKFGDYPRITFSLSIAEYHLCIIKIYMKFLESIENNILDLVYNIKLILKKYPQIVHKSEDTLNGYVLYDIKGNNLHCFNSKDDFIEVFSKIKETISKLFMDEEEEFNRFKRGVIK